MQKPLILYSNQSRVCARLFPFVQKSNISFQQLCVDSDEAKRSCAKWGVQVVPAVIEFEDDNIFYHEGFDMCKNFILENSPIPQPQQSQPPQPQQSQPPQPQQKPPPQPQQRPPPQPQQKPPPQPQQRPPPQPQQRPPPQPQQKPPPQPQQSPEHHNESSGVSTLENLKLVEKEKEVNPHAVQRKKLEAFNNKKSVDAKRLEDKARLNSDKTLKSDIMNQAKKMQAARDLVDTNRERSRPQLPATSTLQRK